MKIVGINKTAKIFFLKRCVMKKSSWSRLMREFEGATDSKDLSGWIGGAEDQGNQVEDQEQTEYQLDNKQP